MSDRLKSFLSGLPSPDIKAEEFGASDPRVAVVALLVHIIDVDGVRTDEEWSRLQTVVSEAYDLDAEETDRLIKIADTADKEAIDFYSFTSLIVREVPHDQRLGLVGMMWEMIFADNHAHELEGHVLWRIAEMLGVDSEQRIAIRRNVQNELGVDRTGTPVKS